MDDPAREIEEQRTLRRARLLNIAYEDLSKKQPGLYQGILSVEELYRYRVVPIYVDQYNIRFGVTNNTSQTAMVELRQRFSDQQISFAMISDMGYREMMRLYDPPPSVEYKDIDVTTPDESAQLDNVSQILSEVRADDMLAYIVKQAYRLKASDIHIENQKDGVRFRFRVDGVLHPIAQLSHDKNSQLMSSLAVAANVSTRSDDAQTGHINKTFTMADGSEVTVNLRVETVPAVYGMDVVLRLFNLKPELMNLDSLGLQDEQRKTFEEIISHPSGLVLMVGPTGSGKTTTLYSIINKLNNPERKIITLEDPVEYTIKGITQIPINSQNDENAFAEKFRAVLRLDPDVIMVGEIRDIDTAKTALQSALTGHLVLSTFHASSAAASMARMTFMIGENPLFSSAVRLIAAQRLVRRLDDATKQAYTPDESELRFINSVLDKLPPNIQKPNIDGIQLYRPGASAENPFGYSGEFAVRELMIMTPSIINELKKPFVQISADSIESAAIQDGMITIMLDAVFRVLRGETSLEEILRVVE